MRSCPSCGRANADDSDFCVCGEYLRWEPTSYVPAIAAPAGETAGDAGTGRPSVAEPDPNVTLAPEALAGRSRASGTPGFGEAPPGTAALMLRLPDADGAAQGPVTASVVPGERVTILGLIRNQSEVVDNFDLAIRGLPDAWWTITPATAYLVPYGAGGTYEQEVQIQIHPPRTPFAQARPWPLEVVAVSRSYGGVVATAPASVTIGPYVDVVTELRPERASGRLKARYRLIVRNRANARTEVALSAEDTDGECRFRFAEPSVALAPGNAVECPFTVFPPRQIWIGRAQERRFGVTAAPLGVENAPPPRMAVYRQRSWLPWWLAIVVPVAAAAAVLAIKLLPKQSVVPNVKGQPSVFAAEKLLNKAGLVLAPKTTPVVDAGKPAGSIADQTPAPGSKARKGTVVQVQVYTGTGTQRVPSVINDTPVVADQVLRASSLALGSVSPQPVNPAGKVYLQLPAAGTAVASGGVVNVDIAVPVATTSASASAASSGSGSSSAAAGGSHSSTTSGSPGSHGGGAAGVAGAGAAGAAAAAVLGPAAVAAEAGGGPTTIPALTGDQTTAAATLAQLGLHAHPIPEVAFAPAGQVASTIPAAGAKVAKGAQVDLVVSSGSPHLAYDTETAGQAIHVIDPLSGRPKGTVTPPAAGAFQVEPSWSHDGSEIIYAQNGQLVLDRPDVKGAVPETVTAQQSGVSYLDPSFAPTTKAGIVAFIEQTSAGQQLCLATVGPNALHPDCTAAPGWNLGGQIDWAPDGSTILVRGSKDAGRLFGLLAFTSNVRFSTQASDWGHGTPVTPVATQGQGVVAGAFSPNGRRVALVSNIGSQDFHLYIVPTAPTGQYDPAPAQDTQIRACQVSWRPDGQQLAVMQPDGSCTATATGTIISVDPKDPRSQSLLATGAADPAWQPVVGNG